jgi:small-conductance mechanosensitive channel
VAELFSASFSSSLRFFFLFFFFFFVLQALSDLDLSSLSTGVNGNSLPL